MDFLKYFIVIVETAQFRLLAETIETYLQCHLQPSFHMQTVGRSPRLAKLLNETGNMSKSVHFIALREI